jgi:DNA invertase Pin-like site-specific DNA recombinase
VTAMAPMSDAEKAETRKWLDSALETMEAMESELYREKRKAGLVQMKRADDFWTGLCLSSFLVPAAPRKRFPPTD